MKLLLGKTTILFRVCACGILYYNNIIIIIYKRDEMFACVYVHNVITCWIKWKKNYNYTNWKSVEMRSDDIHVRVIYDIYIILTAKTTACDIVAVPAVQHGGGG